jgi:O-antigen ligase
MKLSQESLDGLLRKASYWLLFGLVLAIPSLNQPTKALAVPLLLAVIVRLPLRAAALLRQFDAFDWSLVALALAALLSSLFGLPSTGHQGLAEALSHLVVFVAIRQGGYNIAQLRRLGLALVAGAVIAGMLALRAYVVDGVWPISLPAVTGSIRSSLYVGIALALAVGLTLDARGGQRWLLLAGTLFLGAVLLSMTSRAVILTAVVVLAMAMIARYRARTLLPLAAVAVIAAIGYLAMPESFIKDRVDQKAKEMTELVSSGTVSDNDQFRVDHWRIALAWIRTGDHWLFGVGPRNFRSIDTGKLHFDPPLRFPAETREPVHAHNMYLTKYIEEGVVGLTAMLALFALVAWRLFMDARSGNVDWPWWGAFGGLLLPCVNGLVGSPWFREYALLAVMSFALYLATRTARR